MAATTGTVPSMSELIQAGVSDLKAETKADPQLQDLDASKLRITQSTSPREVPEPNSEGVWSVKQCSDHVCAEASYGLDELCCKDLSLFAFGSCYIPWHPVNRFA